MTCISQLPCGDNCLIIGTYNICVAGYDFGSTTGGLTLSRNAEYVDVRNDQSCTRQFRYLKQQDWSFTTTLQCLTLDKLRIIYGMPSNYTDPSGIKRQTMPSADVLTIAEDQGSCGIGSTEEFPVTICGPGPNCGCRIIEMPRVQITPETLDYTITKDNPVQLEVEFTILADCKTGVILTMEDTCNANTPCSSEPIPTGPLALPEDVGPVEDGESEGGNLNMTPGTDPNLTYEINDTDNPCANSIVINPDGSYVITN